MARGAYSSHRPSRSAFRSWAPAARTPEARVPRASDHGSRSISRSSPRWICADGPSTSRSELKRYRGRAARDQARRDREGASKRGVASALARRRSLAARRAPTGARNLSCHFTARSPVSRPPSTVSKGPPAPRRWSPFSVNVSDRNHGPAGGIGAPKRTYFSSRLPSPLSPGPLNGERRRKRQGGRGARSSTAARLLIRSRSEVRYFCRCWFTFRWRVIRHPRTWSDTSTFVSP